MEIKKLKIVMFMAIFSIFAGCTSSDDPKEPDYPTAMNAIDPSVLPGEWILESFTAENGNSIEINYPFTINSFSVKQESDNIVKGEGYELWSEKYDSFTTVNTINGLNNNYSLIGYEKKQGSQLSSSKVYEMNLNIDDYEATSTYILVLTDLSFDDNILISTTAAFGYKPITGFYPQTGVIKMKKIK